MLLEADCVSPTFLHQVTLKGDLSSVPSWLPHPDNNKIKGGTLKATILKDFGSTAPYTFKQMIKNLKEVGGGTKIAV